MSEKIPISGDVWGNQDNPELLYFIFAQAKKLYRTIYKKSEAGENVANEEIIKEMINGENGWQLLHRPPVPLEER